MDEMVESVDSSSSAQSSNAESVSAPVSVNASESLPSSEPNLVHQEEKKFSRDEVAKMMNANSNRIRRELMEELKKPEQVSSNVPAQNSNVVGQTKEELAKLVEDVLKNKTEEFKAQQIFTQFEKKVEAAKSKYNDMDIRLRNMSLEKFPHLVEWANNFDNTADVLYELSKDVNKLTAFQTQSLINPGFVQAEMASLSQAIKANEEALKKKNPNPPLTQINQSANGLSGSGSMSVQDWRKKLFKR